MIARSPSCRWLVVLAGCVVLAQVGCAGEENILGADPPPPSPPPGVDAGALRVEVSGLDPSATEGGSVTATPTGETTGSPVTVAVPASGMVEWSTAVGSYRLTYEPPPEHTSDVSETTVQVTKEEITVVSFEVEFDTPPPPPVGGCEAVSPARCWFVDAGAAGGDGSEATPFRFPQDAADQVGPGDFIYLSGTFTHQHATAPELGVKSEFVLNVERSGTALSWITVKPWPGGTMMVVGDSSRQDQGNLSVAASGAYIKLVGLTVVHGMIFAGASAHDDSIIGNDVGRATMAQGNAGLIRVHCGSTPQGCPYNIVVTENYLHDLYGCESPTAGNCTGRTLTWQEDPDIGHHGCFMIQNASGPIEFSENRVERCAIGLFYKYDNIVGPTVTTVNTFDELQVLGYCANSSNVWGPNNVLGDIDLMPADQNTRRCDVTG